MVSPIEILTGSGIPERLTFIQKRAKEALINGLFNEAHDKLLDYLSGQQSQAAYFLSSELNGVMSIISVSSYDKKEELLLSVDLKTLRKNR
ncbi:hypothetical protein A2767_00265 [Candidatus Roizmanbacteria bacterium RIFCSPHIGHO2_01_FULL_35_10]|uniref:Uncharacterized protein n=1 Tax=Candidatus Roizmanbacteria bacterium RIFCSPLOWO2_01_FULL_35_13 TaxID=1802055 RepID=A0A1F7IHE1_9BACT|nr:MAG: hypothetical protein A2767_00265 [Candidatus Roizmanbacteria bacterium RIFCSPHIGHO2_01_FULL_35_10]OGK42782.1 MAG: hypothetical protein A3A74_01035 [Candidatus Roizmanbacteria bacterium RIFCSPLOWO2_01_FULL_35_13]